MKPYICFQKCLLIEADDTKGDQVGMEEKEVKKFGYTLGIPQDIHKASVSVLQEHLFHSVICCMRTMTYNC